MNEKIKKVRELLIKFNLDGFIFSSRDEFINEYSSDYLNRLKFLTNFTGSNGIALITHNKNYLFTDGRYLLQAKLELGNDYEVKSINDFFCEGVIGYDPKTTIASDLKCTNCKFVACQNLIDLIWEPKPIPLQSKIIPYGKNFAGEQSESKKLKLNNYLHQENLDAIIITRPENICWLLNIRAFDLECTPILLSYAIFYKSGLLEIFANHPDFIPLEEFEQYAKKITHKKVQIDPNNSSLWIQSLIKNPIFKEDPIILWKAIKNKIEIANAKAIHKLDGAALVKLQYWMSNSSNINELGVCDKLLELRKKSKKFICPSFPTIAGFNENGAIIHYRPSESSNKTINKNGLLLLDSGSHYYGGTTDTTRVISFGKATHEQKLDYTLVLKGHIALAQAVFPSGTTGSEIDILARQFLFKASKNYNHGTGHGVGNCLSVHEPPQNISRFSKIKLIPGMILSNEPGYYEENKYGIRIESLLLVKEKKGGFLYFKTLTLAPIALNLAIKSLLTKEEKSWINKYHLTVYKQLSPLLEKKEKLFLEKLCNPI